MAITAKEMDYCQTVHFHLTQMINKTEELKQLGRHINEMPDLIPDLEDISNKIDDALTGLNLRMDDLEDQE